MAYVPQNKTSFTAAFSGCMAGLVTSAKRIQSTAASAYSGFGSIASAFAQSFDTLWGVGAPDTLQVFLIEKMCKGVWEGRSSTKPAVIVPAIYNDLAQAIIAAIQSSETVFTDLGITPDVWPSTAGSATVLNSTWTDVAAGATKAVTANGLYAADSTGALVTFNLPSTPADGTMTIVKLVGAAVAQPVALAAGAGDTVEDPQNAGSFSAVAGSVFLINAGQIVGIKYQAAHTRWIGFVLS